MACHGNHGVTLVNGTLNDIPSWVRMNVGEYLEIMFPAVLPERGVPKGMEGDCTGLARAWIKVVIAQECANAALSLQPSAQEKGAALPAARTTVAELAK